MHWGYILRFTKHLHALLTVRVHLFLYLVITVIIMEMMDAIIALPIGIADADDHMDSI